MLTELAIVASLVALVMELRQTQSALSAETYQARDFDAIGELIYIANSEYLAPILAATTAKSIKEWAPRWRAIGLTEGRDEFREYVDQVLGEDSKSTE